MVIDPIVREFDAYLTPEERALVERAQDFGRRVVEPQAAGWERERRVPVEALREACAAGLAAVEVSPALGGAGLRFSAKLRMVEELAMFDFAFPFALVNHHNATARIAASASSKVAERLVPRMLAGEIFGCSAYTEPGHGSDLSGIVTTARRTSDGWLLDGAKAWITNAAIAGVAITLAQTEPGAGARGMASFVVETDRPGFEREAAYALEGCHAIGAGGFRLSSYVAPDDALLDPPGQAFRRAINGINGARTYVAAMCAGMLQSAIEHAVRYGSSRQAFGRPLVEHQGLRWSLVDAEADLAALRLLTYRAARRIDAGEPAEEDAARAKKLAGERTLGHLAACVQAMGAHGLRADHPLVRHMLAAKTACFTDGTTEMMRERLGKLLLSRYFDAG
ncbi:MAG: acyl-CoA dehydrogenase family protein [Pirellulales bacterium]